MKKVSAIICAFNEEKTLENVIRTASECALINEMIVVNDGSVDQTRNIIDRLKLTLEIKSIHLQKNRGNGFAMATGVENASGYIIIFIDADLIDLHTGHIVQLLYPILNNEVDMVLGQPSDTLINYKINPFKSLTGQRTLRKDDFFPVLDKVKNTRFGVETVINLYYQANGKTVKYIMLKDLQHPTKFQKANMSIAMKEFAFEGQQIGIAVLNNFDLVIKSLRNLISIK